MRTFAAALISGFMFWTCPPVTVAQSFDIVEVWRSSSEPTAWLAGAYTDGSTIWLLNGLTQDVSAQVLGTDEVSHVVLGTGSRTYLGGGHGLLAVYDERGRRIGLFDEAGNQRGMLPVPASLLFPKSLRVLEDGSVLIGSGMAGSDAGLHRLRADGSIIWQTLPIPATRRPLMGRMVAGATVLEDDRLYAAVSSANALLAIDVARGGVDTLLADSSFFPATADDFVGPNADGELVQRWHYPRSAGLVRLPDRGLLHFIRLAEQDSTRWEIVDDGGRLVAGTIPGAYELWGVHTATGALIATRLINGTLSVPVLLDVRERR